MVFDCFGCCALGTREAFAPYLDKVMEMMNLAFIGAIKL